MLRTTLYALLAALLASGTALAQNGDGTGGGGPDAVTADGGGDESFNSLSPGNQKIAKALYDAQPTTDAVTGEAVERSLTLNDIADMKPGEGATGWGEMFHQMQADGQIPPDVKNLGELVSGRYTPTETATTGDGTTSTADGGDGGVQTAAAGDAGAAKPGRRRSQIVITTGSGQRIVVGRRNASGGPKVVAGAGRKSDGVTTAHGQGGGHGRTITVTTGAGDAVGAGSGGDHGRTITVTTAGGGGAVSHGGGHGGGHGVHVTTGAGASVAASGGGGNALGHGGGGGNALGHSK